MDPAEYKPARRNWIREILTGVAVGLLSDLLLEMLVAAARLLV
ncbi:DUF6408 family protein [Streptomyces xinghaiensis]|nr:DUF6408 family protein [Streptomyces xinghaiensis]